MSSAGILFSRQGYVGLGNTSYGTVTAGRQYSSYYLFVGPVGPTSSLTGATGAHPGDIDGLDTTIRSNNSLTYTSPVWSGAQISAMYRFGEVAGSLATASSFSAALKYDYNAASFSISSINRGYVSADSVQYIAAAARHTIGNLALGANGSNVEYRPNSGSLFAKTAVFNTAGLLATYQLSQPVFLSAGYSYTRENAANGITDPAKYHQLALEQTYSFSKRTALYFLNAYQIDKGKTLGAAGTGNPVNAVAVVGDSQNGSPSSGRNQTVLMAGIRYSF